MKKLLITTGIALACTSAVTPVMASQLTTGLKQGAVFSTSTILGAAAGGPVGLMLGALGGAYLGGQIEKADKTELTEQELAEHKMQLADLQNQLAYTDEQLDRADKKLGELSQIALDTLEFQVLFHTGADVLNEHAQERVASVANFLKKHPRLSIRLSGHADPRGTDEYNNVLADQRAQAVEQALLDQGIAANRIERRSYGADRSIATKGDYEGYALERRVDIEIFSNMEGNALVQAH